MYRHLLITTTQELPNLLKQMTKTISTVTRRRRQLWSTTTMMVQHMSNIKIGKSSRIWLQVPKQMRRQTLFKQIKKARISKFKNRLWPAQSKPLCKKLRNLARSRSSMNRRRWTNRWLKRLDSHRRDKVAYHQIGSDLTAPRSTLQSSTTWTTCQWSASTWRPPARWVLVTWVSLWWPMVLATSI